MVRFVDKTDYKAFSMRLGAHKAAVEKYCIQALCYIGEKAVEYARKDHAGNWNDVTGNLRSSIGYMVLQDGKSVFTDSGEIVKKGKEGKSEKAKLLKKLQPQYQSGLVLILCAGMNYAAYVEAKGRDVLYGAERTARNLAMKLLRNITK